MGEWTWEKAGKRVNAAGTTNIYALVGTDVTVESRKRHIPRANGRSGTWDHTTYFVLKAGKEIAEKYSLRDAKSYAERKEEEWERSMRS